MKRTNENKQLKNEGNHKIDKSVVHPELKKIEEGGQDNKIRGNNFPDI